MNSVLGMLGLALVCIVMISSIGVAVAGAAEARLNDRLAKFVEAREAEFEQISSERKSQLKPLTDYLTQCRKSGKPIRLTFICTHNSRRSHMSQLWAAVAAVRYGIDQVETFSGGTEGTAFNPRAVAAMERAGFRIDKLDSTDNPKYAAYLASESSPQICFSKIYSEAPNPTQEFCAVMTCTSADKGCPVVSGASARVAIPFEDPKVADNTEEEQAKYDERAAQIAREILYVFSQVE